MNILIEAEIRRPRGDGLTTKLLCLAKALNYKFVVHNMNYAKTFNDKDVITIDRDIRGIQGGYIFDHHALAAIGSRFESQLSEANETIEGLREWQKRKRDHLTTHDAITLTLHEAKKKECDSLKAENELLIGLAQELDIHTVHTRNCTLQNNWAEQKCSCGLRDLREALAKCAKGEKPL